MKYYNFVIIDEITLGERKVILTDEIEIDIIVLPKIYKLKETNKESKLLEWIYFLENPNSEVVG